MNLNQKTDEAHNRCIDIADPSRCVNFAFSSVINCRVIQVTSRFLISRGMAMNYQLCVAFPQ